MLSTTHPSHHIATLDPTGILTPSLQSQGQVLSRGQKPVSADSPGPGSEMMRTPHAQPFTVGVGSLPRGRAGGRCNGDSKVEVTSLLPNLVSVWDL